MESEQSIEDFKQRLKEISPNLLELTEEVNFRGGSRLADSVCTSRLYNWQYYSPETPESVDWKKVALSLPEEKRQLIKAALGPCVRDKLHYKILETDLLGEIRDISFERLSLVYGLGELLALAIKVMFYRGSQGHFPVSA